MRRFPAASWALEVEVLGKFTASLQRIPSS